MGYYFNIKQSKKEQDILSPIISTINNYWTENRIKKRAVSKTFVNKVIFDRNDLFGLNSGH